MSKRILILDEPTAEFVRLALAHWTMNTEGDRSDKVKGERVSKFHVERQLDGKYTAAEREEILRAAKEIG